MNKKEVMNVNDTLTEANILMLQEEGKSDKFIKKALNLSSKDFLRIQKRDSYIKAQELSLSIKNNSATIQRLNAILGEDGLIQKGVSFIENVLLPKWEKGQSEDGGEIVSSGEAALFNNMIAAASKAMATAVNIQVNNNITVNEERDRRKVLVSSHNDMLDKLFAQLSAEDQAIVSSKINEALQWGQERARKNIEEAIVVED